MGWKTLRSLVIAAPLIGAAVLTSGEARAVGEMTSGFPNWAERVLLEWTNRARVDPSIEMTACGAPCGEKACYSPKPPVYWSEWHGHAARFHSVEQIKQGYFGHDSKCKVVANIKDIYPATCDGSAACACSAASPITTWASRIGLFGVGAGGEIIASPSDPNSAFYLWLFENSPTTTCGFTTANGHRYNILTAGPAVGYGVDGYSTGDFGGGGDVAKIPSGSHYPEGGASVDLWANWYDTAAPTLTQVNVGGTCQTMTLGRGTTLNGAYTYKATGLSGCTRYYFNFKDSTGATVTYPTTGSLGIGGGACVSWDATRPAAGAGCSCTPSCTGKTCGDNGCGGSCGTCPFGKACDATGACVTTCTPACTGKTCGPDGCGGSCGTCTAPATCSAAGTCVTAGLDAGKTDTAVADSSGVDATGTDASGDGATKDSGATTGDTGGPRPDTGGTIGDTGPLDPDASLPDPDGGNDAAPDAAFEGSCSCRTGPRSAEDSRGPLGVCVAFALGIVLAHRRRQRDAR
ncbi:MAG: hypothetical protein ABI175_19810 [Polyangiales bacterium]